MRLFCRFLGRPFLSRRLDSKIYTVPIRRVSILSGHKVRCYCVERESNSILSGYKVRRYCVKRESSSIRKVVHNQLASVLYSYLFSKKSMYSYNRFGSRESFPSTSYVYICLLFWTVITSYSMFTVQRRLYEPFCPFSYYPRPLVLESEV